MESRSAKIADLHLHSRFTDINRANKLLSDIASLGVSDACFQALTYRGMPQNLFMLYLKLKYKGVSVRAFGGIHETDRFKKIPPEKVARKAEKIISKNNSRFVNHINRNPLLLLLNVLPRSVQLAVIRKILKP